MSGREGDPQNGIGAQHALVGRTVKLDQEVIERGLVERLHAAQLGRQHFIDVAHGQEYAFAQVPLLVPVAQFDGLMRPSAGAARHRGPAEAAVAQRDFHFERGIAAAVQNLPRVNVFNGHRK